MTEAFLHYIWQHQYFNKQNLLTSGGESVSILKTGFHNTNAGPDFSQAKIKIENLEWVGHVEIHVQASEWVQHNHQIDKAYDSVVLHVVWKNDTLILRSDGTPVPTLELQNRIDPKLLLNYKRLINHPASIPCADSIAKVNELQKLSTLERALTERLETKATNILAALKKNNNDWEETFYQTLGKNFGFKINSDAFQKLTTSIPYKTILKHADKLVQVEALLLGTAGLLEKSKDDEYIKQLHQEYTLLNAKYELGKKEIHKSQWRYLRLRPANFPTLRIAQFAAMLSSRKNIFSTLLAAESAKEVKQLFDVSQSPYWQSHYHFSKTAKKTVPDLGEAAIENIIINTVVPTLAAYSMQKNESLWMDRAVDFLLNIAPENNVIIREWDRLKWRAVNAFDSQALIELKNNFCNKRRCLSCTIGSSLVQAS